MYFNSLKSHSNNLGIPTGSGKSDYDYPALAASIPSLENLPFYSQAQRTPLPPDLVEQFDRILVVLIKRLNFYWSAVVKGF